jgi:hypothetical protein
VHATGRPDFDINIGDLKPNWLVGVAAVTMLALRQPLTGVKTFGDTMISNPFTGVAKVMLPARDITMDEFVGVPLPWHCSVTLPLKGCSTRCMRCSSHTAFNASQQI